MPTGSPATTRVVCPPEPGFVFGGVTGDKHIGFGVRNVDPIITIQLTGRLTCRSS